MGSTQVWILRKRAISGWKLINFLIKKIDSATMWVIFAVKASIYFYYSKYQAGKKMIVVMDIDQLLVNINALKNAPALDLDR